jgi:hypothetical protein
MSYSLNMIGRDKEKLKAAVRAQQCKDEAASPHSGVPGDVADKICSEIDRVRVYQFKDSGGNDRVYAISVSASGSFHDQGCNHSLTMTQMQVVE